MMICLLATVHCDLGRDLVLGHSGMGPGILLITAFINTQLEAKKKNLGF